MRPLKVVAESRAGAPDDGSRTESPESALEQILQQVEQLRRELAELSGRAGVPPYILARDEQQYHMVELTAIELIEADGNYVRLKVGTHSYRQRVPLSTVERRLRRLRFARVHRSVIVNLAAVRSITPWFGGNYIVEMKSGARVRMSRTYWQRLSRRLSLE